MQHSLSLLPCPPGSLSHLVLLQVSQVKGGALLNVVCTSKASGDDRTAQAFEVLLERVSE